MKYEWEPLLLHIRLAQYEINQRIKINLHSHNKYEIQKYVINVGHYKLRCLQNSPIPTIRFAAILKLRISE